MKCREIILLVLAVVTVPIARASCVPYPAYVYEGTVTECHAATVSDVEDNSDNNLDAIGANLTESPLAILTVRVSRLVQVARCKWEGKCKPAVAPWDDVTPTEFRFATDRDCATFKVGSSEAERLYAVRPCCDLFPFTEGPCGLYLPVVTDPPDWVASIVGPRE